MQLSTRSQQDIPAVAQDQSGTYISSLLHTCCYQLIMQYICVYIYRCACTVCNT